MATLTIRKKKFENIEVLGLRVKAAYDGTVTEEGPLVSDGYLLFNGHFVRKPARTTAEALARQTNGTEDLHSQETARGRLAQARKTAVYEGELVGHVGTAPALPVKAERVAGIRYRAKKKGRWRYVWVDAYRLRLLAELFKQPLRFFCASWDAPVVLRRGTRTVGCLMPASPRRLDIRVRR